MRLLHVANVGFCAYSFFIFIGLLFFAISMHDKAMSNVTTNESIRKKWNAKNPTNTIEGLKKWDLYKFYYFGELPKSRLQQYFEFR